MNNADFYIKHLNLKPHPEGGYYAETYRSEGIIPAGALLHFSEARHYSTAIYYLLEAGDCSAFHRIKSDECWHHYAGDTLLIHVLHNNGNYKCIQLGGAIDKGETFQFVVPAHAWFAAECTAGSHFVLSGCTVAPGFDFADFEMADKTELLSAFPEHAVIISRLCR
ncbi:cupin domain-containing protein [Parafilimonas sp.]|uniref:cupin domain-containing protein n=1 Tax=Parafilimonas sp. TaxID=1969739 RepID=UPI0039E239D1